MSTKNDALVMQAARPLLFDVLFIQIFICNQTDDTVSIFLFGQERQRFNK